MSSPDIRPVPLTEASRAVPATTAGADVGPGRPPGISWAWKPVAASAKATWTVLADTAFWPRWGPSVRAVEPHSGIVVPGQRGRVRTVVGPWLPFVVDEVDPGRSWRWTVAGVAATHHAVEATGPQSSRVGIGVPRLAFPYLAVCRVALGRIARLAEVATLQGIEGGRPLLVSPPYDRRSIESVAPGPP